MSPSVSGLSIEAFVAEARAGLARVPPAEMWRLVEEGAALVDIRPLELRERDGELPGAMVIGMNVLEWRLAPTSADRVIDLAPDQRVILVCDQGYSSSLAASRLQRLGIPGATDVIGGFQSLMESGLIGPRTSS